MSDADNMTDDEFSELVTSHDSTTAKRIDQLERELAEAREIVEMQKETMRQMRELAEACRKLMKVVGAPGTNEWQEIKECDAAYLAGKKALAAVKGGQHE